MAESTVIPDWLPSSATALQSFLKEHPDAESQVGETLDKLLENITANSGNDVVASLDNYFGSLITDMLFDLAKPELGSHLQEFSEAIPAEAMGFLTKFTQKYGPKLANLAQSSNQSSALALDAFLKTHADAETQVREIMAKHLGEMAASTWGNIIASLDNYWGKDSTNILIEIARQADQATRLEEAGKYASPEVMNLLRKTLSLYGPELAAAALASSQLPHGWKILYRDVYYDYVNRRPHIRLRFSKYNGEEPFIEGNADSILDLTILILQTLRFLPVPEFIGPAMADRFIQEADNFINFLVPSAPEVADPQAETKSAHVKSDSTQP